jgi:hypothetical protein
MHENSVNEIENVGKLKFCNRCQFEQGRKQFGHSQYAEVRTVLVLLCYTWFRKEEVRSCSILKLTGQQNSRGIEGSSKNGEGKVSSNDDGLVFR